MTLIIILVVVAVLLVGSIGFFVLRSRSRRPTSSSPQPRVLPEVLATEGKQEQEHEPRGPPETLPEQAGGAPEYRERLSRSRGIFATLRGLSSKSTIDQETIDALEEALLGADVGVATTDFLLGRVQEVAKETKSDDVIALLRTELLEILSHRPDGEVIDRSLSMDVPADRCAVWLFVGVNGVGKTTTIGKLATRETASGKKVVLAAGDTFRAAAAEQLAQWGERSGAEVVRGAEGGDPSSVVYDAIARGKARGCDLVLADTAGRLHNKVNLIEELKKIRRVADKEPGHVAEVLLVLDATTGQNAVSQARQFMEAVDATGVVLSKLDGTARGGVVVAIQRELGLPVKLVGLGEGKDDLVSFDPVAFVDALLAP